MKPQPKSLKLIALLLKVAVLIQGCNIYRSNVSTVEEALASKHPIKIKSTNNEIYKFRKLYLLNEQLYGLAKSYSKTSKLLVDQVESIVHSPQEYVQIKINDEQIKEIHLMNPFLSDISPVLVIVGIAGGLFILLIGGWLIAGGPL